MALKRRAVAAIDVAFRRKPFGKQQVVALELHVPVVVMFAPSVMQASYRKENTYQYDRKMSQAATLGDQLKLEEGPVVLINTFVVSPDEADDLDAAWANDAGHMKAQPGFISTQLHRGIAGSGVFMNYAIWQSVAHFRAAFINPEFQAKLGIIQRMLRSARTCSKKSRCPASAPPDVFVCSTPLEGQSDQRTKHG